MMDKEAMVEELRHFVECRLNSAEFFANTEQEARNCQGIAFGAVKFAHAIGILSYEEMVGYWDNYMWDKFNHIAQNAGKGPKVENI